MSLISIILPTYNGEKYISKAIESCLRQTYTNFELIIVNDCSTDNTGQIIEKYKSIDSRIKVIHNKENSKLPKSLNIGFDTAKGDYFTWTSDDNLLAPHALERLLATLERNSNADIVYSSYSFIDEHDKVQDVYGDYPENLLFSCIVGACFLYKSKVHYELNGYDVTKFRMEDMDFWLRAASKFKYEFIDGRDLYFYRKHTDSLTSGIYRDEAILHKYKMNYLDSFRVFFNDHLNANFSDQELQIHIRLFFEDVLPKQEVEFSLSDEMISWLHYLDKLSNLDWNRVFFDPIRMSEIIKNKKDKVISLVINNLVYSNKVLSQKNPSLARQMGRPISWYYQEYEVLPSWFKKLGHLIKMLQGNKRFPSIISTLLQK